MRSQLATEAHVTNQKSTRTTPIKMIILHHAATTNLDNVINMMVTGSREVSSHLAIKDTRIASVVEEEYRAWSLSSQVFDSKALTVEAANESTTGWTISETTYVALAHVVADWSTRYNIPLRRAGFHPADWTLISHREVYSIHGASYPTACPGAMDLDKIITMANQILGEEEMPTLDEIRQIVQEETRGVEARLKDAVRRDQRARVYRTIGGIVENCTEFFAIDWRLPAGTGGRILYAHGGAGQVLRWFNPYQLVGDSPEQARALTVEETETILHIALGTDSSQLTPQERELAGLR